MIYREMLRLDPDVLLRETSSWAKQECDATVQLLVRLAAVEERRLYGPAGYASMWDYCVSRLGLSEDAAGRRLSAARQARRFPTLFDALADGRIHLTAIHVLAPFLSAENAAELIAAAPNRTKAQLLDWLARRFPRPATPTEIRALGAGDRGLSAAEAAFEAQLLAANEQRANAPRLEPAAESGGGFGMEPTIESASEHDNSASPGVCTSARMAEITALAQCLSHQTPLFEARRQGQFAPTRVEQRNADEFAITFTIDRRVLENAHGRRCTCKRALQFDHQRPVALGGEPTLDNVRLLCPAHNQHEAEQRLGRELMKAKRDAASIARGRLILARLRVHEADHTTAPGAACLRGLSHAGRISTSGTRQTSSRESGR